MVSGPRIVIVFNPTAGARKRRKLERLMAQLQEGGAVLQLVETRAAGDAERIAAGLSREHCDVLAVAGGDGTVNEAVNGLMAAPHADLPALAILPLGTANVLAREIGLGVDGPRAVAACLHGRKILLPMGRITCDSGSRHFVMMAGVGFDAHVVRAIDKALKRRIGKFVYAVESARQLFGHKPILYRIDIDGALHQAASVIVSRGRFYAGSYLCAPEADIAHAALHACLFQKPGRLAVLRYGLALITNRLAMLSDYCVIRAERVTIIGPDDTPVQTDGDLSAASLPVRIDIAERPLAVLGPAG
jgi:diacylglycerol kinase (ATP)